MPFWTLDSDSYSHVYDAVVNNDSAQDDDNVQDFIWECTQSNTV